MKKNELEKGAPYRRPKKKGKGFDYFRWPEEPVKLKDIEYNEMIVEFRSTLAQATRTIFGDQARFEEGTLDT